MWKLPLILYLYGTGLLIIQVEDIEFTGYSDPAWLEVLLEIAYPIVPLIVLYHTVMGVLENFAN